jgi:uncharacterized UPF0146 family protein
VLIVGTRAILDNIGAMLFQVIGADMGRTLKIAEELRTHMTVVMTDIDEAIETHKEK